jgi:hypothetical protein
MLEKYIYMLSLHSVSIIPPFISLLPAYLLLCVIPLMILLLMNLYQLKFLYKKINSQAWI